jgi:hypothetical protein
MRRCVFKYVRAMKLIKSIQPGSIDDSQYYDMLSKSKEFDRRAMMMAHIPMINLIALLIIRHTMREQIANNDKSRES